MWNGVFALLERSLRVDARSWLTHGTRFGLMAAIYMSLCSVASNRWLSAPGLSFFQGIANLDACFMTLLGIGFFSTVITEEREEDTLGLMLMAGISPLGLLMGKSLGRLVQALLLVAIQYPFMLLAVTLGGVMVSQVWAMTVALLSYMIFLAGFGLLCSTIASRSRTAGTMMVIGLLAYNVVPAIATGLVELHLRAMLTVPGGSLEPWYWQALAGLSRFGIFTRIYDILQSGFNESAWTVQSIGNAVVGVVCFGLSWALFGIAVRNPSTEADSRGPVAVKRGFLRFPAGRCWDNPLIWKDFHFVAGGFGAMQIRVAYYLALVIVAWTTLQISGGSAEWESLCLTWILLSLPVDAALLTSRCMNDEVRGQTLAALMMLPRPANEIVYSKFAGAMMGWIPGPVIGLMVLFGSSYGQKIVYECLTHDEGIVVPVGALFLALVPHYSAVAGLYTRWGAVPVGIGLAIATLFLMVSCLSCTNSPADFHVVSTFLCFVFGGLNGACHIALQIRVQSLAEK